MARIDGTPAEILERVQAIVQAHVPTARCELQDYEYRVGCGAIDDWGNIQDVKFLAKEVDEEQVKVAAQVLRTKLASGGSTAGPVEPYDEDDERDRVRDEQLRAAERNSTTGY